MGIKPVQNQFNAGELSPLMGARFDLPAYQYSGAVVSNFIPASEGYLKRRGGTHFVASGKEVDALLFSVVPNVDEAEIIINNVAQASCYCAPGDVVAYTVSAEGYASKSGTYTISEDTTLTVNLVSNVVKYTFAVTATPDDAVVMINGLERKNITAGANSRIEWSVSKSGYTTQSGVIDTINEDKSIAVDLKMRFSIQASPADAVVMINGEERNHVDVEPQTIVNWSVSKDGYQTQSGSQTVTKSVVFAVALSSQVPGQVMFESSTAGIYGLRAEDGLYELLMCGSGGNAVRYSGKVGYRYNNGGSAAVWQGKLRLSENVFEIVVGANETASSFSDIITAGSGKNAAAGANNDGAGGILTIHSASEIVSEIIAANGQKNSGSSPVWAALPDKYKYSYGYGGYKAGGGPAYVRLIYLGKAS